MSIFRLGLAQTVRAPFKSFCFCRLWQIEARGSVARSWNRSKSKDIPSGKEQDSLWNGGAGLKGPGFRAGTLPL